MSLLNFTDKKVLVTGSSKGIGLSVARLFHSYGANVLMTARDSSHFPKEFIEKENIELREVDFLNDESIKNFMKYLVSEKVDILINNAGMYSFQQLGDMDSEISEDIMKINLYVPMMISNVVAKGMKVRRNGRIVNVSSVAGIVSRAGSSAYSASKSGLIGFTRACALDMADVNVLVNAVCPGTTQTEMVETSLSSEKKQNIISNIPLKRLAMPSEIAKLIVFLCSDMNTYMTGQVLIIDGGYTIQ